MCFLVSARDDMRPEEYEATGCELIQVMEKTVKD